MRILSRYVLERFATTFAAALALLVVAVVLVEVLADLDEILDATRSPADVALYIGLRIPSYYLPFLIPVAAFLGAYVAVGSAARAYEIVAMKAGGVSPLRAVTPILAAGAAIAVLTLAFNETLSVRAHDAWRRHLRGEGTEVTFRKGSFWYHKGRYVYNVRDADPAARRLEDVAIFELDDQGRLVRLIEARRAEIEGHKRWRLFDAVIRSFDPDRPEVPLRYERLAETELRLREERALLSAGVSALSIADLQEYREGRPPDDPEAVRASALLHQRLTAPFTALVFTLLAVPLGLRVEQTRSLALPALHGVLLLFAFFTAREYLGTLAIQDVVPAAWTAWGVLAAFSLVGGWLLLRVPR